MKLLLPGDLVRVRPWAEIKATLDGDGMLEGMPFMEEMVPYCGRLFKVWRRVGKTCVESDGVRRLQNVVFLEKSRCNGGFHGGCEKECMIFWKDTWLAAVDDHSPAEPLSPGSVPQPFPFPGQQADGCYRCQSTALLRATSPLAKADVTQYIRDLVHRTWTSEQMLRFVLVAIWLRLCVLFTGMGSVRLRGTQVRTPAESLGLQPGEWVQVKSREEIAATLNSGGRNRGLEFPHYMLPFIGGTFQVRKRVGRIVLETTGELREIRDTVMLEGVTCDGYGRWGGCPRDAFHLWREIWLRRVYPPHS